MDEDLVRLLPAGDALLALRGAQGPTGAGLVDRALLGRLRGHGGPLAVRELAAQTMLGVEAAARAVARLVDDGLVESTEERPRRYRPASFPVEVPWGFRIRRDEGRSWAARLETARFYGDGGAVEVFVWQDGRAGDGGGAFVRSGDLERVERAARDGGLGVGLGGEIVLEPMTAVGLEKLVEASVVAARV